MLLSTDAWDDPRLLALTDRQCWAFIRAFSYSSEWRLPTLGKGHQRVVGMTPAIARKFVEVGLAKLETNGHLTWDCYDLARFTGRISRRERHLREGGYTYLIQAGENGAVKIGSTFRDPKDRLRALQTASSEPLRIVKVLEGAHQERELHERFASFRVRGEWFDAQILTVFQ